VNGRTAALSTWGGSHGNGRQEWVRVPSGRGVNGIEEDGNLPVSDTGETGFDSQSPDARYVLLDWPTYGLLCSDRQRQTMRA
jgi:hypothetical protein